MKSIFKNIKTTLFGTIAGLPTILEGAQTHNIGHILAGIGALLLGLFAKDHNTSEQ
jgi:hypothetical protein